MLLSIEKLVNRFRKLPGVGLRTAERYAYSIVSMKEKDAKEFAEAILEVKNTVSYCSVCGNFSEKAQCDICTNRKSDKLVVVSFPKDIFAFEKIEKHLYHILHGTISPLDGRGPNDIKIKELILRLSSGTISEVILATNPDVEGEATAAYIAKIVKPLGIKVTRIAQGISMGSDIEYTDEVTLSRAVAARYEM